MPNSQTFVITFPTFSSFSSLIPCFVESMSAISCGPMPALFLGVRMQQLLETLDWIDGCDSIITLLSFS